MPVYHNREELERDIKSLPDKMLADGVLIDCPKRRRREQAMGTGMVRIQWPKEQKKRFATQYNRYVELFTKDIGIEILLRLIERPTDEALQEAAEALKWPTRKFTTASKKSCAKSWAMCCATKK